MSANATGSGLGSLGGSTASPASGGATGAGLAAGATTPTPVGGTTAGRATGGTTLGRLLAGLSGAPAAAGSTGLQPNGGVSRFGQLVAGGPLPDHDHLAAGTGGVIDYARLLVSATAPAPPATPSDAFWLNPNEAA